MKKIIEIFGLIVICIVYTNAMKYARSFQHFHGPVSGDDREVIWTDHNGHKHEDYVANPHYEFAYGVDDPHTGEHHGQKEYRDGKAVTGEYTVKEPDGNIRKVRYRADEDGFHAQIINSNDKGDDHSDEGY